jgi:cytochrome c
MGFHVALRAFVGTLLLAIMVSTSAAASAQTAGDREAGWQLARRWCTGCHVVDMSGYGTDTAPPFPTIARERGKDQRWLRAWLISPHPPMPNMSLSRGEIDDVIAYLESLARP